MTASEELQALLTERGVEWKEHRHQMPGSMAVQTETLWGQPRDQNGKPLKHVYHCRATEMGDGRLFLEAQLVTPQQAVDATLGHIPRPDPTWEKWLESLRHPDDDIKTIGAAVEQLMYEAIQFGGDMGPNGNVCGCIDEGDVLTYGFINSWIKRFESTLGRDKYSYEQWRKISDAIGDAMEYAHDKAIEHPDKADPLLNLDEYVNRVLDVAFNGEATLGRGECKADETETIDCVTDNIGNYGKRVTIHVMECSACGHTYEHVWGSYEYCPHCRAKVVDE